MALLKKILKNSANEIIVKWTGSGTDTLTLASIVSTGQAIVGPEAPGAVITGVHMNAVAGSDVSVTRNSEIVLDVRDLYRFPSDTMQDLVLSENPTHDIVLTMGAIGTFILKVRKIQGYSIIK